MKDASKLSSEANNPCLKEQQLAYKCLNQNNFDRDSCTTYFMNYNACNEFWNKVRSDRRAQRISPYLPAPEDRAKIKAEYFEKHNIG